MEDGINLTDWGDVKFPNDVIYISEDELRDLSSLAVWEVYDVADMSYMFCAGREGRNLSFPSIDFTPPGLDDSSFLEFCGVNGNGDMSAMSGNCSSLCNLSPLADWGVSGVVAMENV